MLFVQTLMMTMCCAAFHMIHRKKITCLFLALALVCAIPAFAAAPFDEEDDGSRLNTQIAYFVTIVIGISLALAMVYIAKQTSELKGRRDRTKKDPAASIEPEILKEIKNLGVPPRQQKEAAIAISSLVQEKINAKVGNVTREITDRYTKIIEEKAQESFLTQKKLEKTLIEKKQTEAIVRSVAEGVVVVNDKGEVLLMNPAAEKLLDVKKERKIGRPLLEGTKEGQLFSIARETEGGERDIELNSSEDETKKILRSSSAVIEDENGKTVGMVTVLSDITKQKELDQMKSDFVSSVSHELRNPMGAIQQSISVILTGTAGPITDHQKKFLTNAERNLTRLGILIDDLLDLAKLEARKMELRYAPSSMDRIVSEVFETMETWAKNKNINLVKRLSPSLPEIHVDPDRVTQILVNLISNAIKFTPNEGTITVETSVTDNGSKMGISVADTGIGIAKADISKLFNKFQQVGKKKPAAVSGTGLGLAIVKELVMLHGGDIHVESEPDKGTQFTFTLPLKESKVT